VCLAVKSPVAGVIEEPVVVDGLADGLVVVVLEPGPVALGFAALPAPFCSAFDFASPACGLVPVPGAVAPVLGAVEPLPAVPVLGALTPPEPLAPAAAPPLAAPPPDCANALVTTIAVNTKTAKPLVNFFIALSP
jgi:hypothetical protein